MRFAHALRHELLVQGRTILLTSFAVAGSVMLLQMVRWWSGPVAFNLWSGFGPVTLVIGVIITAGIFGELRSPGARLDLLLRPAYTLEKIGAKLTVSTVVFVGAMAAAYLAASLVAMLLFLLLGGRGDLILFFDDGRWLLTAAFAFIDFLPVQAIFFFGTVYFRRNPAGRTLLAIVGTVTSYVIFSLVMMRLVFAPYLNGRYSGHGAPRALGFRLDNTSGFVEGARLWVHVAPGFLQSGEVPGTTLRILVPLIFWGLAYLRFRETEG